MASAATSRWVWASASLILSFDPSLPRALKVKGYFLIFTPAVWGQETFECGMPLAHRTVFVDMTWEVQEEGKSRGPSRTTQKKTFIILISFTRKTGFLFLPLALHFLIHMPSEEHVFSPLYYKACGSGSNERQDKIPLPFCFFAESTLVPGRLEQDLLGKKMFTSSNWVDRGPANSS